MSNYVVMLFYIYILKLNEIYFILLYGYGVQKKMYDINNNSCLKKIIVLFIGYFMKI